MGYGGGGVMLHTGIRDCSQATGSRERASSP